MIFRWRWWMQRPGVQLVSKFSDLISYFHLLVKIRKTMWTSNTPTPNPHLRLSSTLPTVALDLCSSARSTSHFQHCPSNCRNRSSLSSHPFAAAMTPPPMSIRTDRRWKSLSSNDYPHFATPLSLDDPCSDPLLCCPPEIGIVLNCLGALLERWKSQTYHDADGIAQLFGYFFGNSGAGNFLDAVFVEIFRGRIVASNL